jgi:hypothetical protein
MQPTAQAQRAAAREHLGVRRPTLWGAYWLIERQFSEMFLRMEPFRAPCIRSASRRCSWWALRGPVPDKPGPSLTES